MPFHYSDPKLSQWHFLFKVPAHKLLFLSLIHSFLNIYNTFVDHNWLISWTYLEKNGNHSIIKMRFSLSKAIIYSQGTKNSQLVIKWFI